MGREATHAVAARHPPTPPITDPVLEPHQPSESNDFSFQQGLSGLPLSMAHEAYVGSQYEPTQYSEPHHAIGLGLQYVSLKKSSRGHRNGILICDQEFDPSPQAYYAIHRSHTGSPVSRKDYAVQGPHLQPLVCTAYGGDIISSHSHVPSQRHDAHT